MSKTDNLTDFLSDIAKTIRLKESLPSTSGSLTTKINPQDFSDKIWKKLEISNLGELFNQLVTVLCETPDTGTFNTFKLRLNFSSTAFNSAWSDFIEKCFTEGPGVYRLDFSLILTNESETILGLSNTHLTFLVRPGEERSTSGYSSNFTLVTVITSSCLTFSSDQDLEQLSPETYYIRYTPASSNSSSQIRGNVVSEVGGSPKEITLFTSGAYLKEPSNPIDSPSLYFSKL